MNPQREITIGELSVSNSLPFTLFGGINVLESRELALEVAAAYKQITINSVFPMFSKHPLTKPIVPPFLPFGVPAWKKAVKFLMR